MKKCVFITNVDTIDENLWSGTGFQLYTVLSKNYYVLPYAAYINTRLMCFVIRLLRNIHLSLFATFLDQTIRTIKYRKFIKKNKPDIVFSLMLFNPKKNTDIKYYYYDDKTYLFLLKKVVCNENMYSYSKFPFNKKELGYLVKIENKMLSKIDRYFVMGKCFYDFSLEQYDKKTARKMVYTGGWANQVEPLTHQELLSKEKSFVFVGLDYYRKGCDLVIEAFNRLSNKMPDAKLYIIGINNQKTDNEKIFFLGKLPRDKIFYYLRKSRVFVMPSRFDCFGLVFGEALLNGCVIIGSNILEMNNIINEKNGYRVNPYSPNIVGDLSETMMTAMNNHELLERVFNDNKYYQDVYNIDRLCSCVMKEINNEI